MDLFDFHLTESKGEIEGKICSICKLELRSGQKILQCSFCRTLFHEEHMEEWLQSNTECPVCQRELKKIVDTHENYSIVPDTANSITLATIETIGVFNNPLFSERSNMFSKRVLVILFGMLLLIIAAFAFGVVITDSELNTQVKLIVCLFLSLIAAICVVIIIYPLSMRFSLSYNWSSLEFKEKAIIFNGEFRAKEIKIDLNHIKSIKLGQYTKISSSIDEFSSNESRTLYLIKLFIKLKNRKSYYFKSISKLDNYQEHDIIFQSLKNLIKQTYNIELTHYNE